MVMLGGPKARSQRIFRGIVISLQYVNEEPAIVLFPRSKRTIGNAGGFVVCLSAAWKYNDDLYLVQMSTKAGELMGMTTRSEIMNIAAAINDSLEDLVKMKPEPEEEKKPFGEGTLLGADGQPINFELLH